jgi:hypothetical protein
MQLKLLLTALRPDHVRSPRTIRGCEKLPANTSRGRSPSSKSRFEKEEPGITGLFFGRDSDHNAPGPVMINEVVLCDP